MRDSKEIRSGKEKTIAVFFGGYSTEYEVSLQSAGAVIKNINRDKYNLILIGMDHDTGKWLWYRGDVKRIEENCWQSEETCTPVFPSADRTIHGLCYMDRKGTNETELKSISLDAAFPILHGKNGEDGTLQGTLELMGVPVIGCGLLSSAICMDKVLAHQIVRLGGIRTARSVVIERTGEKKAEDYIVEGLPAEGTAVIYEKAQEIGYPLFVKPVRSGSSFGITKVVRKEQLLPAIQEALRHDSTAILEEMIDGFEVGCAVLGTHKLTIGEVDEIELSDGFFDYTEKYTLKTSDIHVPARITPKKAQEIKNMALKIYRLLKCSHFARVDMFLTPEGEIVFNEVNTIPGFTSHSRYPNMLKAVGISFAEVIERLLEEYV